MYNSGPSRRVVNKNQSKRGSANETKINELINKENQHKIIKLANNNNTTNNNNNNNNPKRKSPKNSVLIGINAPINTIMEDPNNGAGAPFKKQSSNTSLKLGIMSRNNSKDSKDRNIKFQIQKSNSNEFLNNNNNINNNTNNNNTNNNTNNKKIISTNVNVPNVSNVLNDDLLSSPRERDIEDDNSLQMSEVPSLIINNHNHNNEILINSSRPLTSSRPMSGKPISRPISALRVTSSPKATNNLNSNFVFEEIVGVSIEQPKLLPTITMSPQNIDSTLIVGETIHMSQQPQRIDYRSTARNSIYKHDQVVNQTLITNVIGSLPIDNNNDNEMYEIAHKNPQYVLDKEYIKAPSINSSPLRQSMTIVTEEYVLNDEGKPVLSNGMTANSNMKKLLPIDQSKLNQKNQQNNQRSQQSQLQSQSQSQGSRSLINGSNNNDNISNSNQFQNPNEMIDSPSNQMNVNVDDYQKFFNFPQIKSNNNSNNNDNSNNNNNNNNQPNNNNSNNNQTNNNNNNRNNNQTNNNNSKMNTKQFSDSLLFDSNNDNSQLQLESNQTSQILQNNQYTTQQRQQHQHQQHNNHSNNHNYPSNSELIVIFAPSKRDQNTNTDDFDSYIQQQGGQMSNITSQQTNSLLKIKKLKSLILDQTIQSNNQFNNNKLNENELSDDYTAVTDSTFLLDIDMDPNNLQHYNSHNNHNKSQLKLYKTIHKSNQNNDNNTNTLNFYDNEEFINELTKSVNPISIIYNKFQHLLNDIQRNRFLQIIINTNNNSNKNNELLKELFKNLIPMIERMNDAAIKTIKVVNETEIIASNLIILNDSGDTNIIQYQNTLSEMYR